MHISPYFLSNISIYVICICIYVKQTYVYYIHVYMHMLFEKIPNKNLKSAEVSNIAQKI